ncbi:hypothetical protein FB446DRAFT_798148 [Lentinula raphanica]|nr:hypothetical protein FB446DRAFT_798148 [Lentinula raphanica]
MNVTSNGVPPSKTKQRKRQTVDDAQSGSTPIRTMGLGLSDDSGLFFSPTHGHHSIRLLSTDITAAKEKPLELASFTGHASPIKNLHCDRSSSPCKRFVSMADSDRNVSSWEVSPDTSSTGKVIASIQLDSNARNVSVYPIPDELTATSKSNRTPHLMATLLTRSTFSSSSKGNSSRVVASSFDDGSSRSIRVVRNVGGVKPVFDVLDYLDENGNFIPVLSIPNARLDVLHRDANADAFPETSADDSFIGSGQSQPVEISPTLSQSVIAQHYYSLRSYDHFCFFDDITNSTKLSVHFAFFVFFTFKSTSLIYNLIKWITSGWALSLVNNILATGLIIYRI